MWGAESGASTLHGAVAGLVNTSDCSKGGEARLSWHIVLHLVQALLSPFVEPGLPAEGQLVTPAGSAPCCLTKQLSSSYYNEGSTGMQLCKFGSNLGQLRPLCLLLNLKAMPVCCHRQQVAHPFQNNCQSSTRHIYGEGDLRQLRIVSLGQNSQQGCLQGLDNVRQKQQADKRQHQRAP